jgi:predicted nucleic acid-binding Zn ribbon protein
MLKCKLKKCGKPFESSFSNQLFCSSYCRITFFNRKREKKNRQRQEASIQANPLPFYNHGAVRERSFYDSMVLDRDFNRRSYKNPSSV